MQPKPNRKPIIKNLNTVLNYADLPDPEPIQSFINYLQKKGNVQQIQHLRGCYIVAANQKQAYFMVSLCLGGLIVIDYIQEKYKNKSFTIQPQQIQTLKQLLGKFNWSERVPTFLTFKQNATQLGKNYPKLYPIFSKAKQNECLSLFNEIKSRSNFMSGMRIRKWGLQGRGKDYRNQQREHEMAEQRYLNGLTYLVMADTPSGTVNIGVIYIEIQWPSEDTVRNSVCNIQQKNDEQTPKQFTIPSTLQQTHQQKDKQKTNNANPLYNQRLNSFQIEIQNGRNETKKAESIQGQKKDKLTLKKNSQSNISTTQNKLKNNRPIDQPIAINEITPQINANKTIYQNGKHKPNNRQNYHIATSDPIQTKNKQKPGYPQNKHSTNNVNHMNNNVNNVDRLQKGRGKGICSGDTEPKKGKGHDYQYVRICQKQEKKQQNVNCPWCQLI